MSRPRRALRRSPLERFKGWVGSRGHDSRARAGHQRAAAPGYLRSVVAAVAITALGLGAAGAVSLTSSAQPAGEHTTAGSVPSAFSDRTADTSRDGTRTAATDRAKALETAAKQAEQERNSAAAADRDKQLKDAAKAAEEARKQFAAAAKQAAEEGNSSAERHTAAPSSPPTYDPPAATGAKRVYPLSNFRISGRFGQYGPWARWHTGTDFSAPIGTPIHAITTGIVTHVGYGAQASWAGFYITILHVDGYSTLYAHQSPSSYVQVGQVVTTGQQIGIVGMTGRSFGPHCHVELYPPGFVPGDIYHAVDVLPYIRAKG